MQCCRLQQTYQFIMNRLQHMFFGFNVIYPFSNEWCSRVKNQFYCIISKCNPLNKTIRASARHTPGTKLVCVEERTFSCSLHSCNLKSDHEHDKWSTQCLYMRPQVRNSVHPFSTVPVTCTIYAQGHFSSLVACDSLTPY